MNLKKLLFRIGKPGFKVPIWYPESPYLKMRKWCEENIEANTYKVKYRDVETSFGTIDIPLYFEFLNIDDAVLFKITWMFEK